MADIEQADPRMSGPSARARAVAAQQAASDPAVSAFVSASAGSGKTKLLTDRVLRLMLGGADPARIQCLTYTRAAAAEMALRLQAVLGGWVALDDTALDARLAALEVPRNPTTRGRARALFAEVLDLPGGMRIGTIHAFCQSLLRRFPLEARISPHFGLLEEADARLARREAEEATLGDQPPESDARARPAAVARRTAALTRVAGMMKLGGFDQLVRTLLEDRARVGMLLGRSIAEIAADQRAALGLAGADSGRLEDAVTWPDEAAVRGALGIIEREGSAAIQRDALLQLDWLALPPERRAWSAWRCHFVNKDGAKCAPSQLLNTALSKRRPELLSVLLAEQDRVFEAEEAVRARTLADLSAALLTLALPVAARYAAGKESSLRLDYADLIERTTALLRDPGAAWVLYKLDGGLDHLLLDEVQDTAPAQWEIAGALAREFFAGSGAREVARSVFAVGDRKQSIFSFQGADPAAFDDWRTRLRDMVEPSGQAFRDVGLNVSFRSTPPILALVDAVFANPFSTPGVGFVRHDSDRAGQFGRVELWPLAPSAPAEEPPPWQVPRRAERRASAAQKLAEAVADFIATELRTGRPMPSRGRPLRAGDVLILLRSRASLAAPLVRCLKQRSVPVAGLDRMVLTDQPAVQDLLALCETLLLPDDDLALACVLTSPLGGLSDDDLIALAPRRAGSLWDALRARAGERPDWRVCLDFLQALFARVDYVTPHALLAEALGPLGARARLLARLGAEAGEPIDELLASAMTHARTEPPSLQGFLRWVREGAAEVKREAHGEAGGGDLVRVMTVHGAKGLQAPLVILPDTTGLPREDDTLLWAGIEEREVPVWCPHSELRCAPTGPWRDAVARRRAEEHERLLYVALTRAEDWLVVCGAAPRRATSERCWYSLVAQGFASLSEAVADEFKEWGSRRVYATGQEAAPDRATAPSAQREIAALPAWAGAPPVWRATLPSAEPALPARLAPSRPAGAGLGRTPAAASPLDAADRRDARFRRGRLLHALLQHLPDLPGADREPAARRFLAAAGIDDIAPTLADLAAVLDHPELGPLFGPASRAEVPLTGVVEGVVVGGLVDRLAILPDHVLVADYKTTRLPPARVEDVPVLYLRQMAAYRAVLRAALPGRPVSCALVWTAGAQVMPLPQGLLDSHAPGIDRGVDQTPASPHVSR